MLKMFIGAGLIGIGIFLEGYSVISGSLSVSIVGCVIKLVGIAVFIYGLLSD